MTLTAKITINEPSKMKNRLFPIFAAVVALLSLSACSFEQDDLFDKSAAERLNEAKALYTKVIASEGGTYVMEYWPTMDATGPSAPSGQGYLLCMKFEANGSVVIGANNSFTGNAYKQATSLWEVQTDLGAVLSFNSYNPYFHCFSDPSSMVNVDGYYRPTGENGIGVGGDYEFIITDVTADHRIITLKGKKNGTYSRLIRLPEGTNFEDYMADIISFRKEVFPDAMNNYLLMKVGETTYKSEEWNTCDPNIYPFNGRSDLDDSRHPFILNKEGDTYRLTFRSPLKDEKEEESVKNLYYNKETGYFESSEQPQKFCLQGLRDSDMAEFYRSAEEVGQVWQFDLKSGSENVLQALQALQEGSKPTESSKYPYVLNTTEGIRLFSSDFGTNYSLVVNFKQNGTKSALTYKFTADTKDGVTTFTFVEADGTLSKRYQSTIKGLQEIIDAVSGPQQKARATLGGYYVKDVKLLSQTNPESWFVLTK